MLDQLINEIIEREGKKDTNNPNDSGGRTKYGISEKYHPQAWVNGPPSLETAKQIFLLEYIVQPNIHRVAPDYLRDQLADFAVLSGPTAAIIHLQRLLRGIKVDGVLGPKTLHALSLVDPFRINNALVDDRVLMLARIVQKRPKDIEFIFGWQRRALSFRRD